MSVRLRRQPAATAANERQPNPAFEAQIQAMKKAQAVEGK